MSTLHRNRPSVAPKSPKRFILLVVYPYPHQARNKNDMDGMTIYARYESDFEARQAETRFRMRWSNIARNQAIQTKVKEEVFDNF